MFVKHCKVEVYYVELKLVENSKPENFIRKKFSKSDTIGKIILFEISFSWLDFFLILQSDLQKSRISVYFSQVDSTNLSVE